MRLMLAVNVSLVLLATLGISSAAERHWQTGTWKDVGTKRDSWVAGTAPLGRPTVKSVTPPAPPLDIGTPEVATYVLETSELRLELEDTAPIGSFGSFDVSVTIGASVTFAVKKSVAYIRNADGTEHRLRIVKKIAKRNR